MGIRWCASLGFKETTRGIDTEDGLVSKKPQLRLLSLKAQLREKTHFYLINGSKTNRLAWFQRNHSEGDGSKTNRLASLGFKETTEMGQRRIDSLREGDGYVFMFSLTKEGKHDSLALKEWQASTCFSGKHSMCLLSCFLSKHKQKDRRLFFLTFKWVTYL